MLAFNGQGWLIENIIVDCDTLTGTTGLSFTSGLGQVGHCKVMNFGTRGIDMRGAYSGTLGGNCIDHCEVTGGSSLATAAIDVSVCYGQIVCGSNIHDNQCPGILGNIATRIIRNLVTNNTGATRTASWFPGAAWSARTRSTTAAATGFS